MNNSVIDFVKEMLYDYPPSEDFIAVAETGSMSAAANRLYLTQPTVSQAVRDLETHYQVQLFERLHKKLFITEQGQQLLDMARMAVGNFDSLELSMQRFQERLSFRIGASLTVGTCTLDRVLIWKILS